MREIGFIVLIILLFVSLFKSFGAELTNNVTAVALMVLLISLFSDLSEFNFWGLIGKRRVTEKELKEQEGKDAIAEKKAPRVPKTRLQQALHQTEEVTLAQSSKQENFLEIAFAIEKLLRVAANVLSKSDTSTDMNQEQIVQFLLEKGLLTEDGVRQVELIRSLRNDIIHGKMNAVGMINLNLGLDIAHKVYMELRDWVEGTRK